MTRPLPSAQLASLQIRVDRWGGRGVFAAAERRDARWFRLQLVRTSLVLSRLEEGYGLDELDQAIKANKSKAEALLAIAETFPGYKQFLGPDGTRRLLALPVEEQEVIQGGLRELLDARPELYASLGIEEE